MRLHVSLWMHCFAIHKSDKFEVMIGRGNFSIFFVINGHLKQIQWKISKQLNEFYRFCTFSVGYCTVYVDEHIYQSYSIVPFNGNSFKNPHVHHVEQNLQKNNQFQL